MGVCARNFNHAILVARGVENSRVHLRGRSFNGNVIGFYCWFQSRTALSPSSDKLITDIELRTNQVEVLSKMTLWEPTESIHLSSLECWINNFSIAIWHDASIPYRLFGISSNSSSKSNRVQRTRWLACLPPSTRLLPPFTSQLIAPSMKWSSQIPSSLM